MWPLSTEPRPVRGSEPTSDPRTAHPGVVGCRFRPQGASAVGVHKASLTPPSDDVSRPKEEGHKEGRCNSLTQRGRLQKEPARYTKMQAGTGLGPVPSGNFFVFKKAKAISTGPVK